MKDKARAACVIAAVVVLPTVIQSYLVHRVPGGVLAWKSDPSLSGRLLADTSIQSYSFRPPAAFERSNGDSLRMLQSLGIAMYFWAGKVPSPSSSDLSITIIKRPNFDSPDGFLSQELRLQGRGYKRFICSKHELGTINGIPFARAHWEGVHDNTTGPHITRGFTYASTSPLLFVDITGQDTVMCDSTPCQYKPSDPFALSVQEAAVLTFHVNR